jgi:hypothetical protein
MNNLKETCQHYWGDQLIRFDAKVLSPLDISQKDKEVLQEVGLPNFAIEFALIFHPINALKSIEFNGEQYMILGENVGDASLGIFVCLHKKTSSIYQLHTQDGNEVAFFMNDSLTSFLLYLKIFAEFIEAGKELTEDDIIRQKEEMVRGLEEKLLTVDEKALSGDNYYWVLTLAELDNY